MHCRTITITEKMAKIGDTPLCSLAEDGQDGIGLERKKEKVVGITRRRN